MSLRSQLKSPGVQIRVGLIFLGLASVAKWVLQPGAGGLSDAWTDGIIGFLYGVSIGFMLIGIWRNGHGGPGTPGMG